MISSIVIGMKLDESSKESLSRSLNTLSTDINNAEHSLENDDDIPKEELLKLKKKIEQLIGMIEGEDRVSEMEMDEDISRHDEYGNTVVHLLAKQYKGEVILIEIDEMLKDSKSEYHRLIEEPTQDGEAPVYIASFYFHSSVAKCMIEHGADVNKALIRGMTSMHSMALIGDVEKVKEMISKGEDMIACTKMGKECFVLWSICGIS